MVTATKKMISIKKPVAKKATAVKKTRGVKVANAAKTVKPRAAKVPTKVPAKAINKPAKVKKSKLVRDSFTMPEAEYDVLSQAKKKCIVAGFDIKKSELLRIGVAMINALDAKKIRAAQAKLTPLKAGRPSKAK